MNKCCEKCRTSENIHPEAKKELEKISRFGCWSDFCPCHLKEKPEEATTGWIEGFRALVTDFARIEDPCTEHKEGCTCALSDFLWDKVDPFIQETIAKERTLAKQEVVDELLKKAVWINSRGKINVVTVKDVRALLPEQES